MNTPTFIRTKQTNVDLMHGVLTKSLLKKLEPVFKENNSDDFYVDDKKFWT